MSSAPAVPIWPSIPAMLGGAAEQFADWVAIRDGETTLSYAQLDQAAGEFGAALAAAGVEPGDRVAIWCGNCAEWTVAALGLFAAGAVLVPVNTRFKGAEAAVILARSGARVLVTVTDFLGTDYVARTADDRRGQGQCDRRRGVVA
jgi:HIP---CoA ligase